jgi:hypothetical protein
MSGFAELSESDRKIYENTLARFGLTPDQMHRSGVISTDDYGGNLVLSADPATSDIEPLMVPYHSLAGLKAMIGRPDSDYTHGPFSDRLFQYPAPLDPDRAHTLMNTQNACDFDYQATAEEMGRMKRAAECYVMGNSQKLQAFEAILNQRFGTGSIAVLSLDVLVVKAGQTVTFKPDPNDPGKILCPNFTSVTVDNGGQIIVETQIQMTTISFTAAD